MIVHLTYKGQGYTAELKEGIDLSLPMVAGAEGPRAWYVAPLTMEPVREGPWVGSVKEGGAVNFYNVWFNPHGHGTHTECVGHISKEHEKVNALGNLWCTAVVHTVSPRPGNVISKADLPVELAEGLVIRVMPNGVEKASTNWNGVAWPTLSAEAMVYLRQAGVKHLLIDGPSVDPEFDEGALAAHHAFWNYPEAPRQDATITELIYVPASVPEGLYLLHLPMANFALEASPTRPTIYPLRQGKR